MHLNPERVQAADTFFVDMLGTLGMCMVFSIMMAIWLVRRQRDEDIIGTGGLASARGGMSDEDIRALPIIVYQHKPRTHEGETSLAAGVQICEAADRTTDDDQDEHVVPPSNASTSSSSYGGPVCGGSTSRTCAICLDNYTDGDKLRALPCHHRFHAACIDQWLSSRTTLCPVCKGDAAAALCHQRQGEENEASRREGEPRDGPGRASWSFPRLLPHWIAFRWRRARSVPSAADPVPAAPEAQRLLELERGEGAVTHPEIIPAPQEQAV